MGRTLLTAMFYGFNCKHSGAVTESNVSNLVTLTAANVKCDVIITHAFAMYAFAVYIFVVTFSYIHGFVFVFLTFRKAAVMVTIGHIRCNARVSMFPLFPKNRVHPIISQ